jgi:nicotinamide riboside kinase
VDTWLIVTKIWFEFVFKKTPEWINTEILKTKIDLFLVCDIDIPWVEDPVRENGGKNRKILQNTYIENIINYGFNYKIVNGKEHARVLKAIHFVDELK